MPVKTGRLGHYKTGRGDAQRLLLDAHAAATEAAARTAAAHRAWQQLVQLRRVAEADVAGSERQRELLAWQIREVEALGFVQEEWEEMNQEQSRLAHAAGLITGAEETLALLDEGEFAITALLGRAGNRIDGLAAFDPGLPGVHELLAGAAIRADEALHALRRYRDRLDLDPARLAEIDRRIGSVTDVARKYRVAPEELPGAISR